VTAASRGLGSSAPGASGSPFAAALSILFLGDAKRPEFCEARAGLDRWGAVADFGDAAAAAEALVENRVSPDVLVVAQAFPGQFSHEAIDRLRRLAPLARVLGLMGSWCEGEMRSGAPWPATVRTYWHQWPARCGRELQSLAAGQSCSWALPLTATDEERLLLDAVEAGTAVGQISNATRAPDRGLVAICSQSFEMAEWLSAACRSRGYATIWQPGATFARVEGAVAAIFDGTDLCGDEYDALRRFVMAAQPGSVIALTSFPRIEDHQRALSAGAAAVLSKPLMIADLFNQIDRRSATT
jgi:CheY-like chemotaxis protein